MGGMRKKTGGSILPFLKWAGGKRWLTHQYADILPSEYECYVEPFLGSGAVFFFLQPASAVLSDRNAELINVYQQIQKNWASVQQVLGRHERFHSKDYYYQERSRRHRAPHEKAAQFIYLNRTCWNGLYRVNLRGEFNVPIGTKSAVRLDTDDFATTAALLKSSKLVVGDFEQTIESAQKDDFVFIDPPYITSHNLNGFIKYNDHLFSWADQQRLAETVKRAAGRGVKMLITNAAHESIRELYKGVGQHSNLDRASVLAANAGNRRVTTELAITINYRRSMAPAKL